MASTLPSTSSCCNPCGDTAITIVSSIGMIAGNGSPEGTVTGSLQGQIYTDLLTGNLYHFTGTVNGTTGWIAVRQRDYYVTDFGADITGVSDSTDAIQDAVDVAEIAGGNVIFPVPGRYRITRQINVQSRYPVNLVSEMFGYAKNGLSPVCSCLLLGASIVGSMIRYASPTATRDDGGGGVVDGLCFRDETGLFVTPGSYSVTAALELTDFNQSSVQNCDFRYIKGSAIKTDFCVQSTIRNCNFHFCGDTSKGTMFLQSADGVHVTQSLLIQDCKLEACWSAPYIDVAEIGTGEIKIINCGFEAWTPEAGSNQNFIKLAGSFVLVIGCHFNRNTATQVNLTATSVFNRLIGCAFRGSVNATAAVIMAGIDSSLSSCQFNSGKTGDEILVSGIRNTINDCTLVTAGGITFTGALGMVSNCALRYLSTTNAYWMVIIDLCVASGNTLVGTPAGTSGGIKASGTAPKVVDNQVSTVAGIGIRAESSNAVIIGNASFDNTGAAYSFTNSPVYVMGNFLQPGPNYLSNSATYDAGSIAGGATAQTTVTVTDAVQGDFAEAALTTGAAGILLIAQVTAVNTVTVTLWNVTGAPIDLASGTLYVKVRKALA